MWFRSKDGSFPSVHGLRITCLTLLSGNRNVFNHLLVLPHAPPSHHGEVSNLFSCCVIWCRAAQCSSEEHKQLPELVIHAGALISFCAHHLTRILRWGIISRSSSSSRLALHSRCLVASLPVCGRTWSSHQLKHQSVCTWLSWTVYFRCCEIFLCPPLLLIYNIDDNKNISERDEWSSIPHGYWR